MDSIRQKSKAEGAGGHLLQHLPTFEAVKNPRKPTKKTEPYGEKEKRKKLLTAPAHSAIIYTYTIAHTQCRKHKRRRTR